MTKCYVRELIVLYTDPQVLLETASPGLVALQPLSAWLAGHHLGGDDHHSDQDHRGQNCVCA